MIFDTAFFQRDECLRPPSPFILSPPSSLRFDAIAPKLKAKADRRGNRIRLFLDLRMSVRPIQSHKFSKERQTILPLLVERAGARADVILISIMS